MTPIRKVVVLVAWLIGLVSIQALPADNPYQGISTRNVFALKPFPQLPEEKPPQTPPATVVHTGIFTILGDRRALLKITLPTRAPEPAREKTCMMTVGE